MEYTRERLLILLEEAYGPIKSNSETEFVHASRKQVAEDLGYSESQFSRILSPGVNMDNSPDTYKRVINRLQLKLENHQLREQIAKAEISLSVLQQSLDQSQNYASKRVWQKKILWLLIAFVLGIIISAGWLHLNPRVERMSPYVLNEAQWRSLMSWYSKHISTKLALEGLLINLDMRTQASSDSLLLEKTEVARNLAHQIIVEGRNELKKLPLSNEQGLNPGNYLDSIYSLNQIDEDFKVLMPYLLNKNLPPRDFVTLIESQIINAQLRSLDALKE